MYPRRPQGWATAAAACLALLTDCAAPALQPRFTRPAAPVGAPSYQFYLDGKPLAPEIMSQNGTPDDPQPGDAIFVDDTALILGPPGRYAFTSTQDRDGRLWLARDGGEVQVIAVRVTLTFDDAEPFSNPLAELSAPAIAGLRGIYLDAWPVEMPETLAGLNLSQLCLTISDGTDQGRDKTLPPLPTGLRCLVVDESSSAGIEDFDDLARQSELRLLRLNTLLPDDNLRGDQLANNRELRYLYIFDGEMNDFGGLSSLTALRELRLGYCRGLSDIGFVAGMSDLRILDINASAVSDLRPIGGLAHLREVDASEAPIAVLPASEVPALRSLELISSAATDAEVARFSAANPDCRVARHWDEALRAALRATTRVRVRTGGTCDMAHAHKEETLIDERDAEAIAQLIAAIQIDEEQSGAHCMCCGEPSFEFYAGPRLQLTLGLHHGESLRWPDVWPADGQLSDWSSGLLAAWLAARGVSGPQEELDEARRHQEAVDRRYQRYRDLIPLAIWQQFMELSDVEQAQELFENGISDPIARAALYLRLYGCDEGSWNHSNGVDELLAEHLLADVATEALVAAINNLLNDPAGADGAARWLFEEGHWKDLPAAAGDRLLHPLATRALAHPREHNRRRTLFTLYALGTKWARKLLRAVVAGEIAARELPPDRREEAGGRVTYRVARAGELNENDCKGADPECAAFFLSKLDGQ